MLLKSHPGSVLPFTVWRYA